MREWNSEDEEMNYGFFGFQYGICIAYFIIITKVDTKWVNFCKVIESNFNKTLCFYDMISKQ